MTRNQIGITVGTVGFLVCIGAFVASPFSSLQQLACVQMLSCLAAFFWLPRFWLPVFSRSRPPEDNQLKSGFPSLAGTALALFVPAFYTLGGFLRRGLQGFRVWVI